ncbi:unnamed protein product [Nezara viridula]|uniref:Uncharacterized protein n=1 Tax=Nezara viridula TaxID=85310 RepID=A0A9P0EBE4_NEZVI|nr:unnamed protein product [Nezara viridula]
MIICLSAWRVLSRECSEATKPSKQLGEVTINIPMFMGYLSEDVASQHLSHLSEYKFYLALTPLASEHSDVLIFFRRSGYAHLQAGQLEACQHTTS